MSFDILLSFATALFCGGLALWVLLRDRYSFGHRIFAAGLITLALESVLAGLSFGASSPAGLILWQRLRLIATGCLPGSWFLFIWALARKNHREIRGKSLWMMSLIFVIPVVLTTGFGGFLFTGKPGFGTLLDWSLRLGWAGSLFYLFFLISAVFILMNLERVFRASSGITRWRIKFVLLGIGALFASRLYSASQTLLFSSLNSMLEIFETGTVMMAGGLILVGLTRMRLLPKEIYLSRTLLYHSFMVLLAGMYLLAVGVLAKVVHYFNFSDNLPLEAFIVFVAFLGLTLVLLSEKMQQRIKEVISRHFKRPRYDYRREWREFVNRTTSLMDIRDLCNVVVKMVSETFGVSSVFIWLREESKGSLILSGSTLPLQIREIRLKLPSMDESEIISEVCRQGRVIDFAKEGAGISEFVKANSEAFRNGRILYGLPLVIQENLLGFLALDGPMGNRTFSVEDFEFLGTIADQAAGSLLNLKLAQQLRQMKEMEALQNMSTFMIHDLKKIASTFSLTMQNLPNHFQDPEFQKDAIRITRQNLDQLNKICTGLSSLCGRIELKKARTDLNELLLATVGSLNGILKGRPVPELQPDVELWIDPEQIQKVLINLILNANEAIDPGGEIRVRTKRQNGSVLLSVTDTGCGMSKEFMESSLFRPFKTTKKDGMGIGLFQSRVIVEAHGGRFEVESELEKGSTFRVFLPR